jgi:hypothetical protein
MLNLRLGLSHVDAQAQELAHDKLGEIELSFKLELIRLNKESLYYCFLCTSCKIPFFPGNGENGWCVVGKENNNTYYCDKCFNEIHWQRSKKGLVRNGEACFNFMRSNPAKDPFVQAKIIEALAYLCETEEEKAALILFAEYLIKGEVILEIKE